MMKKIKENKMLLPPRPVVGEKKPYKKRTITDPETMPWPLPHPKWYKRAPQRKFKSSLIRRNNDGPLSYPVYEGFHPVVDLEAEQKMQEKLNAVKAPPGVRQKWEEVMKKEKEQENNSEEFDEQS